MSAASDLLDQFAEIGAKVEAAGNRLVVRAGSKPVSGELVRRLREARTEVLAALAPAGSKASYGSYPSEAPCWRRRFVIRTIERELGGYRSHPDAELLAFGDMTVEWHRRHGVRPDPRRCAGCDDELPDFAGIVVDRDNVRVHFDAVRRDECIIAYGQRWRGAAARALIAMGLPVPPGLG
jgi:hypothetical protein